MSLVKELEAKRTIERQQLFEAMSNYLRNLGIDCILATEPSTDSFGGTIDEPVIKLKGQNVDGIHLVSTDYISCGMQGSISRFVYDVILEKKLTGKTGKLLKVKTKSIKEKKLAGLFGGQIISINWIGRDLAELLNTPMGHSLREAVMTGAMIPQIVLIHAVEKGPGRIFAGCFQLLLELFQFFK